MDTLNCPIYAELLSFQNDLSRSQLIVDNPNSSTQVYIQTLARGLGLEFEYSTVTASARVTRRVVQRADEEDFLCSLDLEQADAASINEPLPRGYDLSPSAGADWTDDFGPLDDPGDLSPEAYDPIFSFESAFPELDLPGQSTEDHISSNQFSNPQ